jgi:hypothetical protein
MAVLSYEMIRNLSETSEDDLLDFELTESQIQFFFLTSFCVVVFLCMPKISHAFQKELKKEGLEGVEEFFCVDGENYRKLYKKIDYRVKKVGKKIVIPQKSIEKNSIDVSVRMAAIDLNPLIESILK